MVVALTVETAVDSVDTVEEAVLPFSEEAVACYAVALEMVVEIAEGPLVAVAVAVDSFVAYAVAEEDSLALAHRAVTVAVDDVDWAAVSSYYYLVDLAETVVDLAEIDSVARPLEDLVVPVVAFAFVDSYYYLGDSFAAYYVEEAWVRY